MSEESNLICSKCKLKLEPQKTVFHYLGFTFNHTVLRCPSCGLIYIPEELVTGKMSDTEMMLEEK